jgi:hypothetical protein
VKWCEQDCDERSYSLLWQYAVARHSERSNTQQRSYFEVGKNSRRSPPLPPSSSSSSSSSRPVLEEKGIRAHTYTQCAPQREEAVEGGGRGG